MRALTVGATGLMVWMVWMVVVSGSYFPKNAFADVDDVVGVDGNVLGDVSGIFTGFGVLYTHIHT